jgi:hypothetical protein
MYLAHVDPVSKLKVLSCDSGEPVAVTAALTRSIRVKKRLGGRLAFVCQYSIVTAKRVSIAAPVYETGPTYGDPVRQGGKVLEAQ